MKRFLVVLAVIVMLAAAAGADNMYLMEEDLRQLTPFNIDMAEAEKKGLTEGGYLTDEYTILYMLYAEAFWKYIQDKADILQYDKKLAESDLNFIPKNKERRDVYQTHFAFGMEYLYLMNHFCIERLDENEYRELLECSIQENGIEAAVPLVEKTYAKVIKLDKDAGDKEGYIMETGLKGENLSLRIGIATDYELDDKGKIKSAENEEKKLEYLKEFSKTMAQEITDATGLPVIVNCQ